jgi:hypothetical protein
MNSKLKAIWEKIKRGEALTYAEETEWANRWCYEYPTKPRPTKR